MKKIQAIVKLQIPAGKANPAPPVGPALGQHGVNIMEFCKGFNAQTAAQEGLILPVVVTIYQDRSFSFVVKTPPAAVLLKRAAGIWSLTIAWTFFITGAPPGSTRAQPGSAGREARPSPSVGRAPDSRPRSSP